MLVSTATVPENVSAGILYVGGDGPGNYSVVKYAVRDANPGDTIFVFLGDYYEDIVIDKPLTVIGESRVGTVILGNIRVEADYVNITGFTLVLHGDAAIELYHVRNCRIEDTHTIEIPIGILLVSSADNVIAGNLVQTYEEGIVLIDSWNNHIIDNIVGYNQVSIHLSDSPRNYIVGNSISNEYGSPIHIENSNDVTILRNNISKNQDGIRVIQSVHTRLIDNYIYNNSFGAYLESSDDAVILGNQIGGSSTGVHLLNCSNATISDGVFTSINSSAVLSDSSDGITINGNSILDNGIGIDLHQSANVSVYHNNLINNTIQAYDDLGLENSWDHGYPAGGNHWSDYIGPDDFSGPNQDQPGSDNIGDDPYVIDNNSTDRYPLVLAYGFTGPPEFLSATLTGENLENVTLTWSLSPDDEGGLKSVTVYRLYRGTSFDPARVGYQLMASLPNGTSEYVDIDSGEGNPDDYFYSLCAVDIYNDASCAQKQAGKTTRPIQKGLNLVSIPLAQSNESIDYALQTVEYDKAWLYDSFSQEWRSYFRFKSYRTLSYVNHSTGIWIDVTEDSNLTLAGLIPTQIVVRLDRGWNLIGFSSYISTCTVFDLKMTTGAVRIEGFDPATPYHLRVLDDSEFLHTGEGYWVKVNTDTVWIVEVS